MSSFLLIGGGFFTLWLMSGIYIYSLLKKQEVRSVRIEESLSSYVVLAPKEQETLSIYVFSHNINKILMYFLYKILNFKVAESSIKNNRIVFIVSLSIFSFVFFSCLLFLNVIWAFLSIFLWVFCFRFFYTYMGRRYNRKLYDQLPDTIGMLVRDLRVGMPLSRAVQLVSSEATEPTASEFGKVLQDVAIGSSIPGAFHAMSQRVNIEEYKLLSIVVNLQAESGGTMADIMASLEQTLRSRMEVRRKGFAASGEARMTSYILLAMPIVIGIVLEFENKHYFDPVFTTPNGHYVIWLAVGFWLVGFASIKLLMAKVLG